jgi:DNA-binding response OmpR family regulator
VDVVLVRWPSDEQSLESARLGALPRLLLVEGDSPPPSLVDELEDWIRVPADEADLHARVEALERRLRARSAVAPLLDDDGVLRFGSRWVSLPPVEARITEAMIGRYGAVVSRDALGRAGWPEGVPGRNALDVHVLRLRRRIAPLGLAIRTVRARGYLLEAGAQAVAHA